MRRGVITLRIATTARGNTRRDATERELPANLAECRGASVDFANVVDFVAPSVALDLALVGNLTAGFRIKRRLAQENRDAAISEMFHRRDLRLDAHSVIADE